MRCPGQVAVTLSTVAAGDPDDPILRPAARVILVDPAKRVLLIRSEIVGDAHCSPIRFWHMPGGKIEPGETAEQAARRECAEETGIVSISVGAFVWRRRHVAQWRGLWYDWRERYFLARTEHIRASASNMAHADLQEFREHRWWSLYALQHSTETFVPGRLAALLAPLLTDELPESPIETGI